VELVLELTG